MELSIFLESLKKNAAILSEKLLKNRPQFSPVMQWPLLPKQIMALDFTCANQDLRQLNLLNTPLFNDYVFKLISKNKARMGAGGYLENRVIYRRSKVFEGAEQRCIHLGIDIWTQAYTGIFAPLAGEVHSFQDNAGFGDYGPTIILSHKLEGIRFYTLYGHLSKASLDQLEVGKVIGKGEAFAAIGPYPENGDWPPHLHFQLILDMEGRTGDFPGVIAPSQLERYQALCPDPNLILNLPIF